MFRIANRLAAAAVLSLGSALHAFNPSGDRWANGDIPMQLQLGAANGALLDGTTSWDAQAEVALEQWNANLTNSKFAPLRNSTAPIARGNGLNNVFWAPTVYGDAWDSRTIAIALSTSRGGLYVESDVIFNVTVPWNSYRAALRTTASGETLNEFRRTALHEFGHALGLDHPDDIGQRVAAVMNSQSDDTDSLTADDIAGVRSIYATSVAPRPTITLEGGVGYSYSGNTLTLRAGAIQNSSATRTSGALRLELWAMPLRFGTGLPSGSRLLGSKTLPDPLPPNTQFSELVLTTTFTAPPVGSYYVAMVVAEFTGGSGSGYTVRDFREFDSPLTIGNPTVPVVTTPPASAVLVTGGSTTFTVTASGALPLAYQWHKDGAAIAGATGTSLTVSNAQPSDAGTYTVVVRNNLGTATSNAATLAVGSAANPGRLINLSILTSIAAPGESFTMGYVVGGTGTTGAKPLVIRAAGPSLGALGVAGTLSDPKIELYAGATKAGENDDWGGADRITSAMASVGAFAFASARSLDAAAVADITTSNNSVKVFGVGSSTGTVIGEIYDATPAGTFTTATPRLLNVSVLKNIGTGLTAGFVIGGSTPKTILVRAIGPGLASFGITSTAVADPQLTLFGAGGVRMGENDNWGGTAALTAAFDQVGAFSLASGSRDAAILATLAPGNYTAEVRGIGGTGIALVEIYEVP